MGAGRKTERHMLGDTIERTRGANSSVTARNLGKKRLAAVIFGCTHYTINECLTKLVFGLPASHFSYIKHIDPGLPLFLFNYSDRKLHGIFEAASHGKMNINPYGWTINGSNPTEFPAQVRIRRRKQCEPLSEEQYKKVLHKNYSEDQKHFRFELDHLQTTQLIALFESSPSTKSVATCYNSPTQKPFYGVAPNLDAHHDDDEYLKTPVRVEQCTEHFKIEYGLPADLPGPVRTWSSLFKNIACDARKKDDDKLSVSNANWDEENLICANGSNPRSGWEEETGPSHDFPSWEKENAHSGVTPFWGEAGASIVTPCWEENVYAPCGTEKTNKGNSNPTKGAEDAFVPYETGGSPGFVDGHSFATSLTSDKENPVEDTEDDFVSCEDDESEDEDEDVLNLPNIRSVIYELRKELKEFKDFSVDQFRKACALEKKLKTLQAFTAPYEGHPHSDTKSIPNAHIHL